MVGSALAEVINETGSDFGYSVTAEATSGSQENIRRLASGELDFSLSNAAITYFAVRGGEGWDRAYPVRSVMTLAPNIALFVTQADSGITTLADMRGHRVTVGPAGAGFEYFVRPLLEAHGITYDAFSPLNATQQGAVDMLTDGSADATFLGGAVPTASITQAAASMDITFLPYGESEKEQLVNDYVFLDLPPFQVTPTVAKQNRSKALIQGQCISSLQQMSRTTLSTLSPSCSMKIVNWLWKNMPRVELSTQTMLFETLVQSFIPVRFAFIVRSGSGTNKR